MGDRYGPGMLDLLEAGRVGGLTVGRGGLLVRVMLQGQFAICCSQERPESARVRVAEQSSLLMK